MLPILEARNLTKRYHDFTLREISIDIPRGCIVGLFGPIGAGKTILLKLVSHQILADSGTVNVFGLRYEEREKEIKNRIGYVPQEPALYSDRSVAFNARFAATYFDHWDGGAFYRRLDEWKISQERAVKHLSRGQRTLLLIDLALSHEADLLIFDEPTAGLDIVLRRTVLEHLRKFVAGGERSVLVASHITDGLEEIADYVNFLNEGRLVLQSEKDDLLARWKRIHFRDGALPSELARQLSDVRVQPFGCSGLTGDYDAIRERLATAIAADDVKVENARLDEILIAMLKGE